MYMKTLKYPIISAVIIGVLHLISEAILPDLKNYFQTPVVGLVLISLGIWVGCKAAQFSGKYLTVVIAGVILGILPLLLQIIGFGLLLGRGMTAGTLGGIFGFDMIVMGSVIGGGFALSK